MIKKNLNPAELTLPKSLRLSSHIIGAGSLIYMIFFLIFHTRLSLNLNLPAGQSLILDAGLSLLFFCQHSIMVRPSFKQFLSKWIPEHWFAAVYSISSGVILFFVIFFWQVSGPLWLVYPFWWKCLMGLGVTLVLIGFHWGRRSLPGFDPFGIRPAKRAQMKKISLKRNGPYRFSRHPMYFFILILIWLTSVPALDRMMFNILWTIWIFLGAWFEEKDLVAFFGKDYQIYQQEVPMIIPYKFKLFYLPRQKEN